jgi:hypothetical protein
MTSTIEPRTPWWHRVVRRRTSVNPAAAVYGIVVACAVLAVDSGAAIPTLQTTEAVLGSLLIYWGAETYAHMITTDPRGHGVRVWWVAIREHLAEHSPFMTAPFSLVGVMLLARALGASSNAAVNWALAAGVALLATAGYYGAYRTGRRGTRLVLPTVLGAGFGVVAILLKVVIHSSH